jgi:hypothetical protein
VRLLKITMIPKEDSALVNKTPQMRSFFFYVIINLLEVLI